MNNRRNKPGQITKTENILSLINIKEGKTVTTEAKLFIAYMIGEAGSDMSPSHIFGMTKASALHRLQLAKAFPEKADSIPLLNEAKAFVSLMS